MKSHIEALLQNAIAALQQSSYLPHLDNLNIQITHTKDSNHGDFASNIALVLAKQTQKDPRELAQALSKHIPLQSPIEKIQIAGPGFINFFVAAECFYQAISDILKLGSEYGQAKVGEGKRIHIEYVSANPTGPLHIGHGRGAAYGACVANLLKAVGYEVHREYYVNDVGRQMQILALSIWLRYLQNQGEDILLPSNAYQGDYLLTIATSLQEQYSTRFLHSKNAIEKELGNEQDTTSDKYLDYYIQVAKNLLGLANFELILQYGLNNILLDIKNDLQAFGVVYDSWFYESQLTKAGLVTAGIELLKSHHHVYSQNGALWFKATDFGDEKDRVLVRENGQTTYFASDVAYHLYKYEQGYEHIIDVFGADHHGFIPRLRAFLQGLGKNPDQLRVLLVQFATLYRGKEKLSMSTRSGSFVTLRELREEVSNDAARFFYIMRKPQQHLEFDLELAKSKTSENPIYYIQYAHARICSVWRQLAEKKWALNSAEGLLQLKLLNNEHETNLIEHLGRYPSLLLQAALRYEPHLVAHYLQELAHFFHTYYNAEKFLVEDPNLRNARLSLAAATQHVLKNGLTILGVAAPEKM